MEATRYHVSIHDAHAHLYEVSATFPGPFDGSLEVKLPTWTPGSYLQREFARHCQDVRAEDDAGKQLAIEKTDKHTWHVAAAGAKRVTVRMRVYANDLTVRTSHLDGTHAFFNGANLFLFRKSTIDRPCVLSLDVPEAWRVFTSLPRNAAGEWEAQDYDHLVDCPVDMGTHETFTFDVGGVPHEVAIWGQGNHDSAQLKADLQKICASHARLMGGLPFTRYLFLVHLTDKGRGGLEHRDSTALLFPRFGFKPRKDYEEFLRLASHEYFHSWNVKRLKPKAFDPYDYTREAYTKLLWAMEGFTEYYEVMQLARGGLVDRNRLLGIWGEEITALLRTPGRKVQPLAESSFDTWIKYYRQDENSPNSGISYYRKGALVALALDMEIRARTKNARSIDDVFRLLYERHGSRGKGAAEDAYEKAFAEVGGEPVRELLKRYVETTAEIDFAAHLAHMGVRFQTRPADSTEDKGGKPGKKEREEAARVWLGFDSKVDNRRHVVSHVYAGSPAARAGLYVHDEIIAVNEWRATDEKSCRARVNEAAPGDFVPLVVLRRDRLVHVDVLAGAPPNDTAWLEADEKATPEAKAILESWAKPYGTS